jgi:hypothetical protein
MPTTKEVAAYCEKCKGPIYTGQQAYELPITHVLTDKGFVSKRLFEHMEGECSK